MLKDIDFKKVQDTAMAIVPEEDGDETVWNAYLINVGESTIESVLINSKGYGEVEGKELKTSQLRQFFDAIEAKAFVKLEQIQDELLQLTNEFWISFSKQNYMYDKKYVFVLESLRKEHLVEVPYLNKKGVLIK